MEPIVRLAAFKTPTDKGLAKVFSNGDLRGVFETDHKFPGYIENILAGETCSLEEAGRLLSLGRHIDPGAIEWLPPITSPGKIICVGLNYADHSLESGFTPPDYPTIFARFASSLIGHGGKILRPVTSVQLDYEGELVAIIGRRGRHIPLACALEYVMGYSIFNDVSVRDYQTKSPQWTVGKNFDGTGSFGPFLLTADELAAGAKGLRIQTRLNGQTVQDSSTSDMIFDVASLVSILSEVMTLNPGDVIVTGTPAGVGMARMPQLFMKHGDICEVELEGIGVLSNAVADDVT
jgi:acylpyruvate hydrolase